MGKIAFVFSGQGAQYSGMGASLAKHSPKAKELFELADSIRPGTSVQCFSGTEEELKITGNTQPCLYCVEMAAALALRESGISPHMLAGFSLGEIAALAFSGAVSLADGFSMVTKRGELMQEAASITPGVMVAVLKLTATQVEELCAAYSLVFPVNYNCPGQTVVAGAPEEIEAFKSDVKGAGGRAMPLKVGGGFHSPFMSEAAKAFRSVLDGYEIHEPQIPLYSNYTGKPYEGDMKALLSAQIENPVRWQGIIEAMIKEGADTFIEVGPGKTLCGLIGKISKEVRTFNVEDYESLQATLKGA